MHCRIVTDLLDCTALSHSSQMPHLGWDLGLNAIQVCWVSVSMVRRDIQGVDDWLERPNACCCMKRRMPWLRFHYLLSQRSKVGFSSDSTYRRPYLEPQLRSHDHVTYLEYIDPCSRYDKPHTAIHWYMAADGKLFQITSF